MNNIPEILERTVFMSDLHLEMRGYDLSEFHLMDAELVILAGDIGMGTQGMEWAQTTFKCPVIYLAGNHEYYHCNLWVTRAALIQSSSQNHIYFLDCNSVVIGDVRFVGATIWTDFNLRGEMMRDVCMREAQRYMNDFRLITTPDGPLTPAYTTQLHQVARDYIRQVVAESAEPVVVITHHSPSDVTTSPKYALNLLTAAFCSNADDLMDPKILAWICGHTHHSGIWLSRGVPILSNQLGYPRELGTGFRPGLTIADAIREAHKIPQ